MRYSFSTPNYCNNGHNYQPGSEQNAQCNSNDIFVEIVHSNPLNFAGQAHTRLFLRVGIVNYMPAFLTFLGCVIDAACSQAKWTIQAVLAAFRRLFAISETMATFVDISFHITPTPFKAFFKICFTVCGSSLLMPRTTSPVCSRSVRRRLARLSCCRRTTF